MEELFLFEQDPPHQPTEDEILDKIEFEFYTNKKNFWSTSEVATLFAITNEDIARKIEYYLLDAIRIEGLVKIPYNAIINYIFYHEKWEQSIINLKEYIKSNGGQENYDRLIQFGRAVHSPNLQHRRTSTPLINQQSNGTTNRPEGKNSNQP